MGSSKSAKYGLLDAFSPYCPQITGAMSMTASSGTVAGLDIYSSTTSFAGTLLSGRTTTFPASGVVFNMLNVEQAPSTLLFQV